MAGQIGAPCQTERLVTVTTPWGVRCTVNKAVKTRFLLACKRADRYSGWNPKRIDSYVCRPIRGSSSWSRHAYGAAWDFFKTPPGVVPPGGVWDPDNTFKNNFAMCFKDLGFTWGGDWRSRPDTPHIEWSGSIVPPLTMRERHRTRRAARKRFNG